MKTNRRQWKRGYTLIELTAAMAIGLAVAAMTLSLAMQQFSFLRIFRAQEFLTYEAPVINNFVVKLISQADGFRIHESVSDGELGISPVLEDGSVLVLIHKQPDGGVRESALAYTDPGGAGAGLYYYFVAADGSFGAPQWAVSTKPTEVIFFVQEGILRMRLTGPNGEELTYSGANQL
jgi:prepilin-type N-terminal cleavage/methylation domain-containing protein